MFDIILIKGRVCLISTSASYNRRIPKLVYLCDMGAWKIYIKNPGNLRLTENLAIYFKYIQSVFDDNVSSEFFLTSKNLRLTLLSDSLKDKLSNPSLSQERPQFLRISFFSLVWIFITMILSHQKKSLGFRFPFHINNFDRHNHGRKAKSSVAKNLNENINKQFIPFGM